MTHPKDPFKAKQCEIFVTDPLPPEGYGSLGYATLPKIMSGN